MTTLERVASLLAVLPGVDCKIEQDAESTVGTLYSPCGKEARFYLRPGMTDDAFASEIGHTLLRLADLRRTALLKGPP